MSLNAFIHFSDAKGESLQDGFKEWIEIGGFNWEVTSETSFTKGSGASVGKATPGVASFSHYYDTASPTMMQFLVSGKHFAKVKLRLLKSANGKQEKYFGMDMGICYVTKVTVEAGDDGAVNQNIEFVFKEVDIGYKMQEQSGAISTKPWGFHWDLATMQNSTTAKLEAF